MQPAIKVEDLGKLYRLGEIGTGTLSHDLHRWWARARGKEDPFARIGETNDRTAKGSSDYVWALKDVNFEIKQGEAVGIIGRNGAGKSTLLKILSKVTAPTTGQIKINGRIASLLEVGTGFHPEMTGRENIFLNGAILGMTKAEIKSKFDEIVDFAGVERYVDTPVKRYSSGMYVRLAFAVAAFLEPEILIVDEVLAVGDAEFQKKCLGRMKDVSKNDGRTVLFVSHNLTAIRSLCSSSILLNKGVIASSGKTELVLKNYLEGTTRTNYVSIADAFQGRHRNESVSLNEMELIADTELDGAFEIHKEFKIRVGLENKAIDSRLNVNLFFYGLDNTLIFAACSPQKKVERGNFEVVCEFPPHFFNDNSYSISVMVVARETPLLTLEDVMRIEGIEPPRDSAWMGKFPGLLRPSFNWEYKTKELNSKL
jgi:lipopolysaccharide transport system ATP-binding protein